MIKVDRILAIDYGDKRIGVAISDPLGFTAQEYETIIVTNNVNHFLRIKEIIDENNVMKVLVGMPFLMNGKKGERAEKTEEFIKKLEKYVSVPVFTLDERLTTSEAKKIMISLGQKTGKKKEKIDRLSAALLLENYLRSIT